ncbi:hypothetical protein AB0L50_11925 [Streptomyces flaveolus]|uniref:hypothetical protein n=1 Tax=Streptomyces flaveolus TaxID=67297 RepID=UPI00341EFC1B
MRNRRALTIGVALIAWGALGACQNGDGDGRAAADSSSHDAGSGAGAGSEGGQPAAGDLPQAADMASIEYYLNKYAYLTCGPDFTVPSGYGTKPGAVEGCVLTDHVPSG